MLVWEGLWEEATAEGTPDGGLASLGQGKVGGGIKRGERALGRGKGKCEDKLATSCRGTEGSQWLE